MVELKIEKLNLDTKILAAFTKLTESKQNHCYKVADFMYRHGRGNEEYKTEMYILGLVHDIGYSNGISKGHSHYGGEILKECGYKYWEPVYWHGNVGMSYSSKELDLLNYADMSVNSLGDEVGIELRLDDIMSRYGRDSEQFINAKTVVSRFYTDKKIALRYVKKENIYG